jgi:hypothetical protein
MKITLDPVWRLWVIVFGGHFVCQGLMEAMVGHWWRGVVSGGALGVIVFAGHLWLERTAHIARGDHE